MHCFLGIITQSLHYLLTLYSQMLMEEYGVSIFIITKGNQHETLSEEQIDTFFRSNNLPYEIILVEKIIDDVAEKARYSYCCIVHTISFSILSLIPSLLEKMKQGTEIMVLTENSKKKNTLFDLSVHSTLKLIKKEIIQRIPIQIPSSKSELTFLSKAKDAKYTIVVEELPPHTDRGNQRKNTNIFPLLWTALKLKYLRHEIIPFSDALAKEKGKGFHYNGQEFVHHSSLHHDQTAFHRLSGLQIMVMIFLLALIAEGFIFHWHITIVIFIATITTIYFADLLFNLFLIYRSFSRPAEIRVTEKELQEVQEDEWPIYTVFCPLYKEWQVVPQFVKAISKLEYPKDKLQVMLLLEEDDTETIDKIKKFSLPAYFEIRIVPNSHPKTKPKACNYGLLFAKGEYTVIYDAEDVPDPLQLKKIVLAFQRAKKSVVCIQAKLNFYNPHQNLLTRVFTAEYSLWFDLVLTGLHSINAPIPLGGTSNHFRTKDLHILKGWDSFNVTEDCDLGMRLVKQGYSTAIVDSTTLEEANSDNRNWFWQRTRWIKGYMQTYLLHMRNPSEFFLNWHEQHMITFQLIVGGKIMSMFINPFMWLMTILYFVYRAHIGTFIESFFPVTILYMGVLSLLFGNFLYMYYYMIGCAKHGHDELVKYVFLVPFYWLAMSLAGWVALYKLIKEPHYWSKTKHGLHLQDKEAIEALIKGEPAIAV